MGEWYVGVGYEAETSTICLGAALSGGVFGCVGRASPFGGFRLVTLEVHCGRGVFGSINIWLPL